VSWRYRAVKKWCPGIKDLPGEWIYYITEYYDPKDGKPDSGQDGGWTVDPIHPQGSTMVELIKELRLMLKDLESGEPPIVEDERCQSTS
jgi:hypothetical protein